VALIPQSSSLLKVRHLQEFDTPENLYNQPNGIFRGMCERSSIALEDIKLAAHQDGVSQE
jgi:hypothetical protein